jgi:hypothetical protein
LFFFGSTECFNSHSYSYKLETDSGVSRADEVEELVAVLAHERLDVVTGDVVPFESVVVEVIQDRKAGFVVTLKKYTSINTYY